MIFSLNTIKLIALYAKIQLECISSSRKYHSLMMDPLACFITLFWSSVNTLRILSVSAFGERLFIGQLSAHLLKRLESKPNPSDFKIFGLGWPLPCTISSKFHDAAHKYSWHSRPIFSYSSWSKNDFRLRNGGLKFTLAFRYSRIASTIWYRITGGVLLLVYIESSTWEQSRHSLC